MIEFPFIPIQKINLKNNQSVELQILRDDLNHELISGNKLRKLKYNLAELKNQNKKTLLTFGGAFSNHISATAAAGKEFGFSTIGVIRGEELIDKINSNPTLSFAKSQGMKLHFVSREDYRKRYDSDFILSLRNLLGDFYHLPEGGTNELAIKGTKEILDERTEVFDFICCAMGTGGTISGIIDSSKNHQKILGFPALKNSDFLKNEIKKYTNRSNYEIINSFHFGGYAKVDEDLINFVNEFKRENKIPLDPVYTGKMMFGIFSLIRENYFPKNSKILAVHTGGLQGIEGMNQLLKLKNKILIE